MQTIDIRTLQPSRSELARLVPRASTDVAAATESAAALIDDVRARGELALLEQAEKLDGVRPPHVRVHASEISEAVRQLKAAGARSITLASVLAAPEGIKRLQEDHPDLRMVIAAVDRQLNERGYILPGLGDAGDRIFGTA